MKLELTRSSDDGIETIGNMIVLDDNDANVYQCATLERPYKDNQHGISCIPCGSYTVVKTGVSHIPYPHFAVQNVPNRDGICIHKANYVGELEGCIAVGMKIADINGDREADLSDSHDAFDRLYELMPDEFTLVIK
jgi:hypothetical protein